MKFTLGQIRKRAYNQPFPFEGEVDVSELESMNNDIRQIGSVNVKGECTLQGDQIFFTFLISGEMILPCARTLVDVRYPFEIRANEIFSISPYDGDDEDEEEIHPILGEVLDLTPYIKENILLEVPFRVFAKDETSRSNVPLKGNGWEVISNDEPKEKPIDPRLKKLESLLKDTKKEND